MPEMYLRRHLSLDLPIALVEHLLKTKKKKKQEIENIFIKTN